MTIVTWTPENVKKEVIREVASNAAIVGKFIETDARQRLLAINDPEWGAGYRKMVANHLLTSEVEQMPNEVVIRVGTKVSGVSKSGTGGRHHGFYIELGSASAPPHPWLRPAVFQNAKKIVALLAGK
ncbi:MAG: hypothetical protein H6636_07020 [Anaerolineales bacterium]|nr:hypothetical protein [Anaerolineales bacterium]